MKKSVIVWSSILILTAAAGGFYWYRFQEHPLEFRENLSQLRDQLTQKESDPVYVTLVSTIVGGSSGAVNRYAGVVEPQNTLEVKLESNRIVKKIYVKEGEEVKQGQLLFEYDLSNIEDQLKEENLAFERLKNEAMTLEEQIVTLEKEKQKASKDNQLSYTIEIETDKMNLKKNEYAQKAQEAKIQRLENATGNTEVRSEIDGIVQKIDSSKMTTDDSASVSDELDDYGSSMGSGSDNGGAFIKILSTGAYRVKGKINELNISEVVVGEPVLIRSRVDETVTWSGTMGSIDRDNAEKNEEDSYFGMSSTDSMTSSSSYPFYVELESSEGLMLGQHVYIEPDSGQSTQKTGLWLSEIYIVDADQAEPYVWAASEKNRLEKRMLTLGSYDEELGEYEILDGLSAKDYISCPMEDLEEGMRTVVSEYAVFEGGADMDPAEDEMEDPDDVESFGYDGYEDWDSMMDEEFEEEDWEDKDWEESSEEYYIIDEDGNETLVTEDAFSDLTEEESDELPGDELVPADEPSDAPGDELIPADEP